MEKNYQIWHHRRCIFEMFLRKHEYEESKADDFSYIFLSELNYLDAIFDSDSKNYHAWSHKIWLLERY